MTELLNCPFCGWATGLSVFDGGDQPYWVECPDCCAQGSPEETKAEAIAAWNARASDAEITRLTESMRAAEEREKALREALCEILDLPGEINPSNYDHDDACELNRQFCYGAQIARQALSGAKP